jgi:photosystem II stability/assembly factor-like uncharacterized protein
MTKPLLFFGCVVCATLISSCGSPPTVTSGADSQYVPVRENTAGVYVQSVLVKNGILYEGTDQGLSISTDNGQTWTKYALGTPSPSQNAYVSTFGYGVTSVAVDDNGVIYAGINGGIAVSSNFGTTWSTLEPFASGGIDSDITGRLSTDGTTVYAPINSGNTGLGNWVSLANAAIVATNQIPINPSTMALSKIYPFQGDLYAVSNSSPSSSLQKSTDGGATWTNITPASLALTSGYAYDIVGVGTNLVVATYIGIFISADGGATWTNKTTANGLIVNYVVGLSYDGQNIWTIYDGNAAGVSYSSDGGNTWSTLSTPPFMGAQFGSGYNSAAYAIATINASGSTILIGSKGYGLAISLNGGATWIYH